MIKAKVSNELMRSALYAFDAYIEDIGALLFECKTTNEIKAIKRTAYAHTRNVERIRFLTKSAGRSEGRSEPFYYAVDEFCDYLEDARPDDATARLTAFLLYQTAERCK